MNRSGRKIVVRADGNSSMGLGHIVRSGALSDMLDNNWERVLYTRCTIPSILEEARTHFSEVICIPSEIEYVEEAYQLVCNLNKDTIVVLDGYAFGWKYQEIIKSSGSSLVCIDDIHSFPFLADVIINTSGGLSPLNYESLPSTQFFLGPQYALIRKPFLSKASKRKLKRSNNDVIICLGGSDPEDRTSQVLNFIWTRHYFDRINIVVGSGYRYRTALEESISSNKIPAVLFVDLKAPEMADLMASCSYAVCSPSSVAYEYLTIGGVLFLKQIADNQLDMMNYLVDQKLAFPLELVDTISQTQMEASLISQAHVFDGKSGNRVRVIIENLGLSKSIVVRRAEPRDLITCFNWANDPDVREQSYNNDPITLASHEKWFLQKVEDRDCYFYILELDNKPMAQIRFQVSNSQALLSYLVDRDSRGKGLGPIILSKGLAAFLDEYKNHVEVIGFVKFANVASQRSFERLHFQKMEAKEYESSFKYILRYERNYNR